MAKIDLSPLETKVRGVAGDWPNVTSMKMFGCPAFSVNGNIFALVWKEGRIGFRLPDAAPFEELMGKKGSGPWKAGPMTISHWVLVPEGFHDKPVELKKWARKAYELNSALPAKEAGKKKAVRGAKSAMAPKPASTSKATKSTGMAQKTAQKTAGRKTAQTNGRK